MRHFPQIPLPWQDEATGISFLRRESIKFASDATSTGCRFRNVILGIPDYNSKRWRDKSHLIFQQGIIAPPCSEEDNAHFR